MIKYIKYESFNLPANLHNFKFFSSFLLRCLQIQFLIYILKVTILFNKITHYKIENQKSKGNILMIFLAAFILQLYF